MADGRGEIRASAQRKHRQVDAFLRHLAAALDEHPPGPDPLTVVDLGCGNAALTFAAHRYLTHVRGLRVRLVGVDVKAQAVQRNRAVAESLGCRDVSFVQGRIAEAEVPAADIVLALHACDTATDEALARAVAWGARIVLASPCCHHDLQRQMADARPPDVLGLVARHGILCERLADVLTDACRAALLKARGYTCRVVEFTGADLTPRNTLLRAVRKKCPAEPSFSPLTTDAHYSQLTAAWNITPHLQKLLDAASG